MNGTVYSDFIKEYLKPQSKEHGTAIKSFSVDKTRTLKLSYFRSRRDFFSRYWRSITINLRSTERKLLTEDTYIFFRMRRWKLKKLVPLIMIISMVCYVLFQNKKYDLSFNSTIPGVQPIELWEFVSDFNNMRKINPNILSFRIESDENKGGVWKYKVYYTEYLSQLPMIKNYAWADYEARQDTQDTFSIFSHHKTCFMTSLACVHTNSIFKIKSADEESGSQYTELISYECPRLFFLFCQREALVQRHEIRDNLLKIFDNNL